VLTPDALRLAKEKGYDLVLVVPNAQPPVARISDVGKIKYELSKKEKETRKSQRTSTLKEVKISPKIAQHDFEVRVTKTKELLEKKHKVKISMYFRGRENNHVDLGRNVVDRLLEAVAEIGKAEGPPKKIGKNMFVILSPK